MKNDELILGLDKYYSMDTRKTWLNNNVLVVGASGAGKTRGIVTPNILQAYGSYIISDPKGNLYGKYKEYLEKNGYRVVKLDFTDPENSEQYNCFRYIRSEQDIMKIAHMLIYQHNIGSFRGDPFWDEASQVLIQALIAYIRETALPNEQCLENIMLLLGLAEIDEDSSSSRSSLDLMFENLEKKKPDSFAVESYKRFRIGASRTLKSILISSGTRLGKFMTREVKQMTKEDTIDITSIGDRKTAVFVVASDTDRSMDGLVNIFFTQAMNELCWHADKECPDNELPVPVRFILDDFATNCKIEEFPRMISAIRSRGISAMIMIQAESQLMSGFGEDGRTIISNCDTYVYLGTNDVDTAQSVSLRLDIPLRKILNMPVGHNWIFRRGEDPVYGETFPLEKYRKIRFEAEPAKKTIDELKKQKSRYQSVTPLNIAAGRGE